MLEYRIEEDGPVYTELWLLDDRPHREDGPACILRRTADGAVGFELWCREGRLHRDDGPAALQYDFDSGRVVDPSLLTGHNYRVDIAFLDVRVILEVDGPTHSQPLVAVADTQRDADLRSADWLVLRVNAYDLDVQITRACEVVHALRWRAG